MKYLEDQLEDQALIIGPDEGELLEVGSSSVQLKLTSEDTKDQLGIYQITLAGHSVGANLHYHRFMDETFIVNEGLVTIETSGGARLVPPGTIIHIPRFTAHGFRNEQSKPAKITLIFNPGARREGFFYGLKEILSQEPINQESFIKLYHKYDSYPI